MTSFHFLGPFYFLYIYIAENGQKRGEIDHKLSFLRVFLSRMFFQLIQQDILFRVFLSQINNPLMYVPIQALWEGSSRSLERSSIIEHRDNLIIGRKKSINERVNWIMRSSARTRSPPCTRMFSVCLYVTFSWETWVHLCCHSASIPREGIASYI